MYDKYYRAQRSGFSMIVAIFVIVLVAWLGAMVLNMSAKESKSTGDRYLRYQAELLADSATDYALMRVGDYNESLGNNCLEDVNITVNDSNGSAMFNASSVIYYSYKNPTPIGFGCNAKNILASNTGLDSMVLIDTTVTAVSGLNSEPIRIHRRSWQKP